MHNEWRVAMIVDVKEIIEIVKELLECNNDELDYNFDFPLSLIGMNSIRAIELIVKLEEKYNIEIDDQDLLLYNVSTINAIVVMLNKYKQ